MYALFTFLLVVVYYLKFFYPSQQSPQYYLASFLNHSRIVETVNKAFFFVAWHHSCSKKFLWRLNLHIVWVGLKCPQYQNDSKKTQDNIGETTISVPLLLYFLDTPITIPRGVPLPGKGKVGRNWSARSKTTLRSKGGFSLKFIF